MTEDICTMSKWWEQALADPTTPRTEYEPQCGYYARRVYGTRYPVRIWARRDEHGDWRLFCRQGNNMKDPDDVWLTLKPISVEEWQALEDWHKEPML